MAARIMTELIDHAAEALALINHPYPPPPSYLAQAHIHATLALGAKIHIPAGL